MTMLQHGLVPSTGGYQIERSLRFNSADSAYLNRTPASAGNRKTWTWSAWFKKSLIADNNPYLFSAGASAPYDQLYFDTNDKLNMYAGGNQIFLTNAVYRDPSAWYHIVWAVDTTQATSTDRIKLYVNGVAQTFATYNAITQNTDTKINNNEVHNIGRIVSNNYYLNGYLTDVYFIDGSAKVPGDFGETDTDTGVWKPKAYTGTYGTNGFFLKFADNSGTTSTTLGKDSSGNGNNWTPNNFSVTAGAGNDSLVDTPTPYGTDTGAGGEVRGNYATLNPLITPTTMTIVNGNLDLSGYTGVTSAYGTFGMSSGKWYFEYVVYANGMGGISGTPNGASYPGQLSDSYAWDASNAGKYNNGIFASYGSATSNGDIVGVAFDADAGTLVFYKNGVSQGTAYSSIPSKTYFPVFRNADSGGNLSINFGQRPFAYTAPSGFKALCTQNLPTPTIGATSATQAQKYFDTTLYTGNGSAGRVITTNLNEVGLAWVKIRSGADDHRLANIVTGGNKHLKSNTTEAESASTNVIQAFSGATFTVGSDNSVNANTSTYVAWSWAGNGAGSTNNAGSIQSTVSASTLSGFSIVTFTSPSGTGNFSAGHGLGVTPEFVIVKSRDAIGNWYVYHKSLATNNYLELNSTNAVQSATDQWGAGMTSSVIGLRASYSTVPSATTVAYCFAPVAGYSAFGKYTGNGSSDGTFVYTGFRPKFVMVKNTSATSYWQINDTARNSYNLANLALHPNVTDAEATYSNAVMDILSNGFKLRGNDTYTNANTNVYIYMAFAEVPTKFSLAR